MAYANKLRIEIERKIAAAFIGQALKAGYSISVYDSEEVTLTRSRKKPAILKAMFTTDEDYLLIHTPRDTKGDPTQERMGWARFIYGNDGWDVISDYTTNLEPLMTDANKVSDKYQ